MVLFKKAVEIIVKKRNSDLNIMYELNNYKEKELCLWASTLKRLFSLKFILFIKLPAAIIDAQR